MRNRAFDFLANASSQRVRYVIFLTSNIVQKTGQLFLVALLVYLGTVNDVYRFGLYISVFSIFVPLLTANIHTSIGRIYYDIESDHERRNFVLSCLIFGSFALVAGGIFASSILKRLNINDDLTQGNFWLYLLILISGILFLSNQFFNILLRLENRPLPYFLFGIITGLGAILISIVSIVLGMNPFYAAICGYSGAQLAASISAIYFSKEFFHSTSLSKKHIKSGLKYSSGTALFAITQWVVNYSGRWIGGNWVTDEDMASYTLISQLIIVLAMMLTTLYESNRPVILRCFVSNDLAAANRNIRYCFINSLRFVTVTYILIGAFSPALELILPNTYRIQNSWILAAFCQSMMYAFSLRTFWIVVGLRRTKTFAFAGFLGAAVNILIALTATPLLGAISLFFAAIIGLFVQTSVTHIILRYLKASGHQQPIL